MRIAIAAVLAAAVAAGLSLTAEAAPAKKKKYAAPKERVQGVRPPRAREGEFGYDNTPDHYPVGSSQWWRAMEREGRGGFGDTM